MSVYALELSEKKAKQLYDIYVLSFPSDELRPEDLACKAFLRKEALHFAYLEEAQTSPKAIDLQQVCSFASAYHLSENTLFIEYLLTQEHYRGQGFAKNLLKDLQKQFPYILIEIEIPNTEDPFTFKRKDFYEALGFRCLSKDYFLPQMDKTKEARPMWLYLFQKEPFATLEQKENYLKTLREDLKTKVYFDLIL